METKNIRQFNLDKQTQERDFVRHEQALTATHGVSNTVIEATAALIKYLEGRTSKTEITNHLESIGTPDALKVIPAIEALHETLKTHENTDLSEVTTVMRDILEQAKQIPKELPEHKEQKLIDYSPQLKSLEKAVKAIQDAVKAQKLHVEAPNVNVKAPNVHVDAPDLSPISDGLSLVERAVKAIPAPKLTDGVMDTIQTNTIINFAYDEYRMVYDSFDDTADPQVDAIRYFLKGKKVATLSYKYDNNGNITSCKRT